MSSIPDRIRRALPNLTRSQQKVARLVLSRPREFAVRTAADLGRPIGVSETTVIRFCHALGYKGFADMQQDIRQQLLAVRSPLDHQKRALELARKPHLAAQVMGLDLQRIQETMAELREEDYQAAVDRLTAAASVLVVGLRTSYPVAAWLASGLNLFRAGVHLYRPDSDDPILLSAALDSRWTVVVISFARYAHESTQLARQARDRGAWVLAVTDSLMSPVSRYADCVLRVVGPDGSALAAVTPTFSLLNALLAGIAVKDAPGAAARLEAYEAVRHQFAYLFEKETE